MMDIYIPGFGIGGFKSFGDVQYISPLGKINLFVGQNNCGKSNVLRFILAMGDYAAGKAAGKISGKGIRAVIPNTHLNRHQGPKNHPLQFSLPLNLSKEGVEAIRNRMLQPGHLDGNRLLANLLTAMGAEQKQQTLWFNYSADNGEIITPAAKDFFDGSTPKYLNERDWRQLWNLLTAASGGSLLSHVMPETLARISPLAGLTLPPAIEIKEQRKIGAAGTVSAGHNGDGLIDRLAELQNPSYEKQQLKKDFDRLNSFVKEVIENSSARIEIPADRSTINVEVDGRLLPIESLGSGIHQVIILGAAATTIAGSMVCIEEPEVHLHPRLQRKLLSYLGKHTSNQYFITTHSAHMLDAANTSVFHVRLQEGQTIVTLADSPTTRFSVCHDLGYHASDIMQSPCVIWVEGPSDRIYIRHWLRQIEPALEEDVHYSIMFYGGRLLSHLTPLDPEVDDFISLRRLNRNLVVVIDSDKKMKGSRLNSTKKRVVEAFNEHDGFAWVTEGREIENYIDPSELENALRRVVPKFDRPEGTGQFDKALNFFPKTGGVIREGVDKVKLAKDICTYQVSLGRFDLARRLAKLSAYIKQANHID